MTELNPELIERAAKALYKWDCIALPGHMPVRWEDLPESTREMWRRGASAALEAVADDLRAEGVDSCASVHEADAEQCPDPDGCRTPTLCRQVNLQVARALREHAAELRGADK